MENEKAYLKGVKAFKNDKKWKDNPYPVGTSEYQAWVNGFGEESDKLFLELIKINPSILSE